VTAVGQPARTERSARAHQVVAAARKVIEAEGRPALTMRRLGDELGIRAPSLYKHFPDKAAVELAVIEDVLAEVGAALHATLAHPLEPVGPTGPDGLGGGGRSAVERLLGCYRRYGLSHPHLYRLATSGPLVREALPEGLDEWAGQPFFLATGDPHRAQALWSLAHGMVILEIDGRYADPSQLDRTWSAAADAFR
jgi:AcrR family transcriptional regulator